MNIDEIVGRACAATGLESDGGLARAGLSELLEAFSREPDLSAIAPLAFYGNCVRKLQNHLALEALAAQQPSPPVGETVVIVGLPRSGSTLLHNLLALEHGTGSTSHFDLTNAWWRLGSCTREDARQDVGARLDLMDALDPSIRDIHPVQIDWPDECTLLFEATFASLQWPITYGLLPYLDWLRDLDQTPHYDFYVRALAILLPEDRQRTVLKSPAHSLHLEQLLRVLPQARLVQTVRRSHDVVPSWLSLLESTFTTMHTTPALRVDLRDRWLEVLSDMADGCTSPIGRGAQRVHYDDLVIDPQKVVGELLRSWGREVSDDHAQRMTDWMSSPEARRRGPAYSADRFDLRTAPAVAALAAYDTELGLA